MITNCQIDPERLAPLRECMETYGQEGSENAEWPWNCLSRRTVAYSCGMLRRGEEPAVHNHDEAEFALCRRLADEAAGLMEGVEVGMWSESSDYFAPFFIVASEGAPNPQTLNANNIRTAFGGTIYPETEIVVEPLLEQGEWWTDVTIDCGAENGNITEEVTECLRPFRSLMQWFRSQSAFSATAFVEIGDSPLDDANGASVFPRLVIGLTPAGSLAGIAGYVVRT